MNSEGRVAKKVGRDGNVRSCGDDSTHFHRHKPCNGHTYRPKDLKETQRLLQSGQAYDWIPFRGFGITCGTRLTSTPFLLLNTSASDVAFFSSQQATLPLLRPKGSQQHRIHGRVLQGREHVEEVFLGQVRCGSRWSCRNAQSQQQRQDAHTEKSEVTRNAAAPAPGGRRCSPAARSAGWPPEKPRRLPPRAATRPTPSLRSVGAEAMASSRCRSVQ